jgi:hypothetical protein
MIFSFFDLPPGLPFAGALRFLLYGLAIGMTQLRLSNTLRLGGSKLPFSRTLSHEVER